MTVDVVYVAASAHDARFTRTCVASVRTFYPNVRVRLLPGGRLSLGLVRELRRHWDVGVQSLPPADYGWGFVKLEPLFGSAGERFLVLDSDTVLTGPVLEAWADLDAPFLVDDEQQSEEDTRRLYYDWEKLKAIDPAAIRPAFVFNSGQWFGTAGVLTRDDFSQWIEWKTPRHLRHASCFMPGDQGVLNYVLNQKAARDGLFVARRQLMRWPGRGMQGLTAAVVAANAAPPLVVHWAGLKRARHRDITGGDLLSHFERLYYARLRGGQLRCALAGLGYVASHCRRKAWVRVSLAQERILGRLVQR